MKTDYSRKKCSAVVYAILIGGNIYIGSSVNVKSRLRDHLWALKKGVHKNPIMQRCFNKYRVFLATIVTDCCQSERFSVEQKWIDDFIDSGVSMNIARDSVINIKQFMNQATKEKIGKAHAGKKFPEASKLAVSSSLRKYYQSTAGMHDRSRRSERMSGQKMSDETRQKVANSLTGKKRPPEVGRKISESLKGNCVSLEVREKIRHTLKGRKIHESVLENMRNAAVARRGVKQSREQSEASAANRAEFHVAAYFSDGSVFINRVSKVAEFLGKKAATVRSWVRDDGKFQKRLCKYTRDLVSIEKVTKELPVGFFDCIQAKEVRDLYGGAKEKQEAIKTQDTLRRQVDRS